MHGDDLIQILLDRRNSTQLKIRFLEKELDAIDVLINSIQETHALLTPQPKMLHPHLEEDDIDTVDNELVQEIKQGSPLPISPVFEGMKFIDAVQNILKSKPGIAVQKDSIAKQLYNDIVWQNAELRRLAGSRLNAILTEGKNQGRWEKIPGEQCYQIIEEQ